jgi:protein SCO1/2
MTDRRKSIILVVSVVLIAVFFASLVTAYVLRSRRAASQAPAADKEDILARPPLFAAPPFSGTDQDGKPFTSEQLKGKVWLADFIFTQCPGPCPMMTARMRRAQVAMGDADVWLISFSLDPWNDTPAALKAYTKAHGADESRWRFITADAKAIFDIARGMRMHAAPATADSGIEHDTHFVLIDRAGQVRNYYSGADEEGWRAAAADAVKLARGK